MRISDWSSDVCSSDLLFSLARDGGVEEQTVAFAFETLGDQCSGLVEFRRTSGLHVSEVVRQLMSDDPTRCLVLGVREPRELPGIVRDRAVRCRDTVQVRRWPCWRDGAVAVDLEIGRAHV